MKFHVDEHIPAAVVAAARRKGIDVSTPADAGLLGASDIDHLRWAGADGRVMVTNDDDYLDLHRRGEPHSGILFFPHRLPDVGVILGWIELCHVCYEPSEMAGRVEYAS